MKYLEVMMYATCFLTVQEENISAHTQLFIGEREHKSQSKPGQIMYGYSLYYSSNSSVG